MGGVGGDYIAGRAEEGEEKTRGWGAAGAGGDKLCDKLCAIFGAEEALNDRAAAPLETTFCLLKQRKYRCAVVSLR
jgi:hypothetical protein